MHSFFTVREIRPRCLLFLLFVIAFCRFTGIKDKIDSKGVSSIFKILIGCYPKVSVFVQHDTVLRRLNENLKHRFMSFYFENGDFYLKVISRQNWILITPFMDLIFFYFLNSMDFCF